MNYLLSILFSLLLHPEENYTANSVDWLCYESEMIALVKMDSCKKEKIALFDYPERFAIYISVSKSFKGNVSAGDHMVIYATLNSKYEAAWKKMVGNDIFMFLKTLPNKKIPTYWVWDPFNGVIDISNPEGRAITGDFNILIQKLTIESYIEDCLKKLQGKTVKKAFLETPSTDGFFPINMEGIYVPDVLYPEAKLVTDER